jgi:hypothetical protein
MLCAAPGGATVRLTAYAFIVFAGLEGAYAVALTAPGAIYSGRDAT